MTTAPAGIVPRPSPSSRRGPREGARQSLHKRRAILDAATDVFLSHGYLGTSMDEVATRAAVSKQTVYQHFASKEALFVEIVTSMTDEAGNEVLEAAPAVAAGRDVEAYLRNYAYQQLSVVLTPRLMQLRRLVIGEVSRFPELARVLHERGPQRAIEALAVTFTALADRGLLAIAEPLAAASQFNWLVMAAPLNLAMLLGDSAIPKRSALRQHASDSVGLFLASYGTGTTRRTRGR